MHVSQLQQTSNMWKEIDLDPLYLYNIYISFIDSLQISTKKVYKEQGELFCLGFKSSNQHAEIFTGVQ